MQEMIRGAYLVSAKGGVVDYVTPEGETLLSVAVPPGRVSVAEYLELCPDGAQPQVSKGLYVQMPRSLAVSQQHELSHHSGANPLFEPTSAEAEARRMEYRIAKFAEQTMDRIAQARAEAVGLIETIPRPVDPVDVVGDDDGQSAVS